MPKASESDSDEESDVDSEQSVEEGTQVNGEKVQKKKKLSGLVKPKKGAKKTKPTE